MQNHLMHHQLAKASIKHPEKEAIITANDQSSTRNLEKQSNQLAATLQRLG
jgi:non-ribosomal peptide synthetase component E (peptide arylation enzyme)